MNALTLDNKFRLKLNVWEKTVPERFLAGEFPSGDLHLNNLERLVLYNRCKARRAKTVTDNANPHKPSPLERLKNNVETKEPITIIFTALAIGAVGIIEPSGTSEVAALSMLALGLQQAYNKAFDPQKYREIQATAKINKIIDTTPIHTTPVKLQTSYSPD